MVRTVDAPLDEATQLRNAVAVVVFSMRLRGHEVSPALRRCLDENAEQVRDELVRRFGYVTRFPLEFARLHLSDRQWPSGV